MCFPEESISDSSQVEFRRMDKAILKWSVGSVWVMYYELISYQHPLEGIEVILP